MKVLLITHGTRGDIQPFVALAKTLKEFGHEIWFVAPTFAIDIAREHDIRVNVELEDVFGSLIKSGTWGRHVAGPDKLNVWNIRRISQILAPMIQGFHNDFTKKFAEISQYPADVIVYNPYISVFGDYMNQNVSVPTVLACLDETSVPTSAFPNPLRTDSIPSILNWAPSPLRNLASWHLETIKGVIYKAILSRVFKSSKWYIGRGIRARSFQKYAAVVQASSRHVLPHPVKYPSKVNLTGYWFLPAPQDWSPVEELYNFINEDGAPIFFGFGSHVKQDPVRVAEIIRDTVQRLGRRAIVVGGWGGISPETLGENIHYLKDIPFDWLFPRMAVLVHHAGTGTCAAGLAAGRPQVLCPLGPHGRFQAGLLYARGVAPPPVLEHEFNPENLSHAISSALEDQQMNENSRNLGAQITAEGGVRSAVKIIETVV